MSVKVVIEGADDGRTVNVTEFGQLVVAPIDYSVPVFQEIDATGTAFSFIPPKPSQAIVITDIILSTDRTSPTAGSRVEVYEADSADSITATECILVEDLARQARATLVGLNLFVPEGRWVNIKTDGQPVLATIGYYYVPKR
jgi:hypothetical protein